MTMNSLLLDIGMNSFLLGALFLGFTAIGMFFVRFYRRTHDRFFAFFAVAFAIMALNQLALLLLGEASEYLSWVFVVRLAAFLIILLAILDKNRK
jgi:hypothetical protein